MIRRTPSSTRTDPLCPYTTLIRSDKATVPGPAAVEPLDHKGLGLADGMDLGIIHRKAEGGRALQAVIFVLDAVGEVNPVRQLPDRRLADVCGRRRTMWLEPATVEPEQHGFLLADGDQQAEPLLSGEAHRGRREDLPPLTT